MTVQETTTREAAPELRRHRFTVGDYYRMAEVGILGEDDRVELIEGEILDMSPIGPRHAGRVIRLTHLIIGRIGDAAIVSVQNPVRLSDGSEPEPDLLVLRPRADFYTSAHPTPADVLLLIEVADSSIEYDRQIKLPLYASSGIQELWLVDLTRDHVVVYRDPAGDAYASTRLAWRGETINPAALPDLRIAVDDILG